MGDLVGSARVEYMKRKRLVKLGGDAVDAIAQVLFGALEANG